MMRWRPTRTVLYALLAVALSVAMTLVAAELALRLLPYNEGLRALAVDADNPIFRFTPDRTAVWSEGWDFAIVNTVHVNNDGFVNDQDYDPAATTPLFAVIGDSYVEAGIVPYEETLQGRLQRAIGARGRVYSFAASGAGLSQYLVWARYARERYRPGGYVFVIIGNDFAESLHEREHSPGFHRFERQPDGGAVLDYEPSPTRRVLRRSALAMYLITNVKVQRLLDLDVQNLGERDRRWVANAPAAEPAAVLAEFRWAVLRFLELLPEATGVEPSAIVLVIDGFRPEMYGPAEALALAEGSTWGEMRAYLAHEARARGVAVVDMHPVFTQRYARDGRRFEFPTDSHWNGEGHGAAADAVSGTDAFRRLFP